MSRVVLALSLGLLRRENTTRLPTSGLIYEHLGWQAQMPLFEGLAKTYQFFRDSGA